MAQVARYPVIVAADSDVAVGPDYLSTLAATLTQPGVGAVTCLYRGLPSSGFWSRLAAMAVHDHFLPTTILGLALGLARPCLGATIALSRETLSRIGGFETVANQLADDYAIGKAVREAGLMWSSPQCSLPTYSRKDRFTRWFGMSCVGRARFSPSIRSVISAAGSPTPCRWL